MPSEKFAERLRALEEHRSPPPRDTGYSSFERLLAVCFAVFGSVLCFLVLKGMTLAYFGPEEFAALTAALGPRDPGSAFGLWFSGADPVSQTIADLLRPTLRL
jgi:hypothetical protein